MGVVDDEDNAQAAVETLERAGVADQDPATFGGEERLRQVDAEGVHGGGVTHNWRSLQRWTVEGHHCRRTRRRSPAVITSSMSVCTGAGSLKQSC